ncbi:MAG: LacI family DNA-binding transcriptional regulator [Clostridia bacterium]|nr:LacI family DNA-binding transcriptional regulator [Clostridia bacterium]
MSRQATLRDIARHCGLSIATVSRVLSDSDYVVSEATRQRVLASAEQLHYMPNELGKSLKTSSTRDIGVILPNITNPYYALLLQGITDEADRQGYHVLLCSSHRNAPREADNISRLLSKRVDGILLSSINPDPEAVRRAVSVGCRLLALEQPIPLDCPQVGFDYRLGAMMATEHLLSLGHRRIGFLGAPLDRPSRRMMLEGYRAALTNAGIAPNPDYEMLSGIESERPGIYEIENGRESAQLFMHMSPMPTGYIAINDMTAIGAMRAFTSAGLRIPEDISVIGFDNIPYCELSAPPLTTIDQHAYSLGSLALRCLLDRDEPSSALPPTLVERCSTGPVKE